MCLVGVALLVLLGCCLVRFLLLFDSAWWNRGIAEEVTMASYGKAVTGTAVMARSANEEKKKKSFVNSSLRFLIPNLHPICTCSCLFTPLTEGRSARDLTQAATSQKKTVLEGLVNPHLNQRLDSHDLAPFPRLTWLRLPRLARLWLPTVRDV